MNLFEARLRREDRRGDERFVVEFGRHRLALDAELLARRPALAGYVDRPLVLGIRPESMEDAALVAEAPDDRVIDATADLVERTGADAYVHFALDAPTVLTDDTRDLIEAGGRDVGRFEAPSGLDVTECVARVSPHTTVSENDTIRLLVDTTQLQLFDADSGLAIRGGESGRADAHVTGGSGAGDREPALEEVR
jgi:multiple sugar transport system ATP-binding protein